MCIRDRSTTVVEVGVNVPNATVMMVENAERFGLAQLHQLRGRVGRGAYQSYCIFMQGNEEEETSRRLEILNKSNDGFFIAGEDLKLRGPGDLFGIRQSGQLELSLIHISMCIRDRGIIWYIHFENQINGGKPYEGTYRFRPWPDHY